MADELRQPVLDGIDRLEIIGRGGFAVVYRGYQEALRRDVAIKVIQTSGLDSDARRRFDLECQALGRLSHHPWIVTLHHAGFTQDGRPYLIMEYIPKGSIEDQVARTGPLSWQDATVLGVRLAGALETAHRAHVLHRDIKPANVLRAEHGEQLSDFGIARVQGADESLSGKVTASVAYAAPEVLDGARATVASDVYALGATLFAVLNGRPAFVHDSDEGILAMIRRVLTEELPDLRLRGIPDQLATLVETAMARDPGRRFQSAEALGLELRSIQAKVGLPVTELLVYDDGRRSPERPTSDETNEVSPPHVTPSMPFGDRPVPPGQATSPSAHRDLESISPRSDRRQPTALVVGFVAMVILVLGLGAYILLARSQGDEARPAAASPGSLGTVAPTASEVPSTSSAETTAPATLAAVATPVATTVVTTVPTTTADATNTLTTPASAPSPPPPTTAPVEVTTPPNNSATAEGSMEQYFALVASRDFSESYQYFTPEQQTPFDEYVDFWGVLVESFDARVDGCNVIGDSGVCIVRMFITYSDDAAEGFRNRCFGESTQLEVVRGGTGFLISGQERLEALDC